MATRPLQSRSDKWIGVYRWVRSATRTFPLSLLQSETFRVDSLSHRRLERP